MVGERGVIEAMCRRLSRQMGERNWKRLSLRKRGLRRQGSNGYAR